MYFLWELKRTGGHYGIDGRGLSWSQTRLVKGNATRTADKRLPILAYPLFAELCSLRSPKSAGESASAHNEL